LICGREWVGEGGPNPRPFCHKLFGDEDKHALNIPAEVQARLDEDENRVPVAVSTFILFKPGSYES
jgi:hypothetical protein